ncbi:MAG: transcription-repair coupling factor [Planctomycetota bacterium]
MVIPSITADPVWGKLKERLLDDRGVVHATGLWGSSAPMVAAHAAASQPRVFLYLTAHAEQADDARDDLELFLQRGCELFPAWETLAGEGASANEIQAERIRVCNLLQRWARSHDGIRPTQLAEDSATTRPVSTSENGSLGNAKITLSKRRRLGSREPSSSPSDSSKVQPSLVIVVPVQALMQPVPTKESLAQSTLHLRSGGLAKDQKVGNRRQSSVIDSPDALLSWAMERGFERLDMVESPGDVARRGDIVDLFVPGEVNPYRIQFGFDQIESIRRIDIGTQRSLETLPDVSVTAMPSDPAAFLSASTNILFEHLPSDACIVLDEPAAIQEMGRTLEHRIGVSAGLYSVARVLAGIDGFRQLHLTRFPPAATSDEAVFDFRVTSLTRFEGESSAVIEELRRTAKDQGVHIFCDTDGERQRLLEMLGGGGSVETSSIQVHRGLLHRGFEWTATKTVVISHDEIFRRQRQRRRIRRVYAGRPIESWVDLKPGEPVVHVMHGIAVYRGLVKLRKGDSKQQEEFLTLEFAERAVLHVPCSQIDLVQKYIGAGGRRPTLSTLGGKRWAKAKEQVTDAVSDLAESLLRIQAARAESFGTAYPADTEWQREFEASFPYDETEDQLTVAASIRDDLTRARPMDRVVCGDVGYGKTELAMRAAFKVVEFGRQVAVLVPTTVLAEQHYETFKERMSDYPFSIGCLSRFRHAGEQKKILDAMKKGQLDLVIGTHRLLSKDVSFADLGLVIIDEEQRFGVEHKERLKAMRETVDILTLTATPIPRTLHMSLVGIRDISSLQTPPVDRRAIVTEVQSFSRSLIRDAILREMNRDGQVFFVHNYVQSIAATTATVCSIVPEARVVYAHGQMKDEELEDVMHRFARKQADVLVTTTIIESGIDLPSVNTIFINRADRFGLADLHQLRGRVGRSNHRAYCYLLLSPDRPPTSKAAKRLKTIEEFSDLGAGFRIAMRDLEIRGAGNLLGKEQSGHIAVVGYEMYCRLLEQTVRQLKNEPDPSPKPVQIDLNVAAHVPKEYIASDRLRIETYRRLVTCATREDLLQLQKDLEDTFGPIPKEVTQLLDVAEIRVYARRFGLLSITLRPPDVIFTVEKMVQAQPIFRDVQGTVRMPDERTLHWRPPQTYLETQTLIPLLRRMLSNAAVPLETNA